MAYHYMRSIIELDFLLTLMRADHGTENNITENLHQCLRNDHDNDFAGPKNFIRGKSVANERIERAQSQLRPQVTGYYIDLFKNLEHKGLFTCDDKVHIKLSRFGFGFALTHDLQNYKEEWNDHRIRRQRNRNIYGGIPNVMYTLPAKYKGHECKKPLETDVAIGLLKKYTSKPRLNHSEFYTALKKMNISQPITSQEGLVLYEKFLKVKV